MSLIISSETFDGWYEVLLKRRRKAVSISITRHLNRSERWGVVAVLHAKGIIEAKNAALRVITHHQRMRVLAWGWLLRQHVLPA